MAHLPRAERRAIWQDRVDRYLESNQTVADFCESEGLSAPSFYQWKRRLIAERDADESPRRDLSHRRAETGHPATASKPFTELLVTGECETAHAHLPNGISISLGRDVAIAAAIVDRLVDYKPATEITESRSASGQ